MSSHFSPPQIDLLDLFDKGDMTDDTFKVLALEAGLSQGQVSKALRERAQVEAIQAEEMAEARAAGGHFGIGVHVHAV